MKSLIGHPVDGDVLVFLPGEREIRELSRTALVVRLVVNSTSFRCTYGGFTLGPPSEQLLGDLEATGCPVDQCRRDVAHRAVSVW